MEVIKLKTGRILAAVESKYYWVEIGEVYTATGTTKENDYKSKWGQAKVDTGGMTIVDENKEKILKAVSMYEENVKSFQKPHAQTLADNPAFAKLKQMMEV